MSARITPQAKAAVKTAIDLAGGREVCFVCSVDEDGTITAARVVARGDVRSVLALPGFAKRGELLLHNHPSGLLEPSGPDLEIAAKMHDDGIGFAITNNAGTQVYVVVEVPKDVRTVPLDLDAIDASLGPNGEIAAAHGRYEDRPTQRDYARTIAKLYNTGGIGLLEAGTGVGKSLGYLVPAIAWAHANNERTIVSTNTINLQEQLVSQDLPFLAQALQGRAVKFALLKGWRNYLCLLRLEHARVGGATLFEGDMGAELDTLHEWAQRTTDGSLSDLTSEPHPDVWDEVAAEPDLCLRLQCSHFEQCFVFAARRRAAQADVVVVNHHLLLADLAVRRASQNWEEAAVLPPFTRLVVDEGHHLEEAAAKHLGSVATKRGLQRLFGRLERRGRGLLPTLAQRLSTRKDLLSVASLDLVHAKLFPSATAAREKGAVVMDLLEGVLQQAGTPMMRLTYDFARDPVWDGGLDAALTDLLAELTVLGDSLRLIRERMETDDRLLDVNAALLGELRGVTRRLDLAGDALRRALVPSEKVQTVRWLEVRGRERNVAAAAVPLDLAPILRDDLFRRVDTTIVTSATLSTEGRFDFMQKRLGLDEGDVEPEAQAFASPFDYFEQSLLVVPVDIPAPNDDGGAHLGAVIDAIERLADASGGGIFGLFTSHRDVRESARVLREQGFSGRFTLLVHGEDGRAALLQRFKDAGNAVLLGTASFWEGVDVPGDALRGLLLAKLPFKVPTEPLTAAHCEAINARGGDAFQEYMLPHAALRLKQGFGRLIRSRNDQGVVVLLDPRVANKRYGEDLLDGLPPAARVVAPSQDVWRAVRRFYQRAQIPQAL